MDYLQLTMWLLSLFSIAVLSCWLAYQSAIVQDIKDLLGLSAEKDYSKFRWKPWVKPLMFVWLELRALLNCPFCISFWLGLLINLLLWQFTIPFAIIYAMLAVFFVELYRKLTI